MDAKSLALTLLGKTLQLRGYRFVAVTPATHYRVLDRPPLATTLESIFGWNRPFEREALDPEIFDLLKDAEVLEIESGQYKSGVRFATVDDLIFAHSAFPTADQDAVFFGPDTYRFIRLLRATLPDVAPTGSLRLIDIGSGSGAGGIVSGRVLGRDTELVLSDVNRKALAFSAINAAVNDVAAAKIVFSDVLAGIEGPADVIVANPPYLVDDDRRLYRHGGGELGISANLTCSLPVDQPVGKDDRCKAEKHTDKDALSTYGHTFRQQAITCGEHHTAGDRIGISEPENSLTC